MAELSLKTIKPLRFGLIGAGAIAQQAYLPVFKEFNMGQLTCLVDTDVDRALALAKDFDLSYVGKDLESMFNYVDAVIVAVPNYLHFPISKTCLEAGKHVLCEKPMTIRSESASELVGCAKKNGVKLGVAHVRRFYPSSQSVKQIIKDKLLGDPISFDCQEGLVFSWPTTSGFFFNKEQAGGGVLMDIGVHLLDLLIWWFESEPILLEYKDDNLGGLEAFSRIKLKFDNKVEGTVKISRLSQLRNNYRIKCEKGTIEYKPFDIAKYFIYDFVKEGHRKTVKAAKRRFNFTDAMKAMLEDFCVAIRENHDPIVTGQEGKKVIKLIEEYYQNRKRIDMHWL
jgi:predicted dehydrogenase